MDMSETPVEISPPQPATAPARLEQSKGVWALGWITILWSGLQLLWSLLVLGLTSVFKSPLANASSLDSAFQQVFKQADFLFQLKATSFAALAYFAVGVEWVRSRGWSRRALAQCTIAGILAVLAKLLFNALVDGPSPTEFIFAALQFIVPVGVLAYVRQAQVRRQFYPENGPQSAVASLLAAVLVFGGFTAPSAKRYLDNLPIAEAAKNMKLIVWDQIPNQELRGKYVILSFWASWCGPCRRVLPELRQLQKNIAARGDVRIVGVSLDSDRTTMEGFAKRNAMAWPHVFDGQAYASSIVKSYGVTGIPHELLLGPDGSVILKKASVNEIEEKLKSLPDASKFAPVSAAVPLPPPSPKPLPAPAAMAVSDPVPTAIPPASAAAPSSPISQKPLPAPAAMPANEPIPAVPGTGSIRGEIKFIDVQASVLSPIKPRVRLWKLSEHGGETGFTPRIDHDTYEFSDVPVGRYQVLVTLDANVENPPGFSGDFSASPSVLNMVPGGVTQQDISLQQIIHLTKPVDNSQRFNYSSKDPRPEHKSPLAVAWDPVLGATQYRATIIRFKSGEAAGTEVASMRVAAPKASFDLEPSGENERYVLNVTAYYNNEVVGTLETFGKDYRAWDYIFRITQ